MTESNHKVGPKQQLTTTPVALPIVWTEIAGRTLVSKHWPQTNKKKEGREAVALEWNTGG